MGNEVRIENEGDLRVWLEGRPREEAVAIAVRVAMRVAPIYWAWEAQARDQVVR